MYSNFTRSLSVGKRAEERAEKYFNTNNIRFVNVSDDTEYQKKDIDFITEQMGSVEVKQNLHKARKGKEGYFFFVETEVGNNPDRSWWNKSKAEWFMFFSEQQNLGIKIKNDFEFRNFVNDRIINGDHSPYGENRMDFYQDVRSNGVVIAKNMRVYLDSLNKAGINFYLFRLPAKNKQ